jgi:uncharacterized repeat protein (TIGR03943 family)
VKPATQATLLLATGFVAVRLVQTDAYVNYLKPGMGRWLLIASIVLVVVGLSSLVRSIVGRRAAPHEHPMTMAAWLLVLPALALVIMPTDPLGAFAADRRDIRQANIDTTTSFEPLPAPSDGVVEIGMRDFVDRAFLDRKKSLAGKRIRLTGFVSSSEGGPGASFVLSRFVILCCAADAYPVEVNVFGGKSLPVDTWVVVDGKWRMPKGKVRPYVDPVEFDAETMRTIQRPENPYDSG